MAKASVLVARQAKAVEDLTATVEELARRVEEMKKQLNRIEAQLKPDTSSRSKARTK